MLAAGSIVISCLGATGAFAAGVPSPDSTVVRNGDQWYTQAYENTSNGQYTDPEQSNVTGPQRAPFGTGSHRMAVGQFEVQTELYRTNSYDGVDLGEITRLEYSTYANNTAGGADRQPTYLRLSVDEDGAANGVHNNKSLFFFPGNNGPVVNDVWQHWDVDSGLINEDGDSGVAGTTTLAAYTAAHPEAVLVNEPYVDGQGTHDSGAVALISGAANTMTRGEYFVDRVIVGQSNQDTLFDFGPDAETDGGTTDLTVDPDHAQGWQHQAYDDVNYLNSNQQFVTGPATPPAGDGSLRMSLSTADNDERVELFRTEQYDGTLVRDLRTIGYSTYTQANANNTTPQQPVFMRLSVDTDGNGSTDDSLYFYPANNGTPAQNEWQTWDAGNGIWGVDGDQGPQSVTLEQYTVAHPDATIVKNEDGSDLSQVDGGVAFIAGGGGLAQMNGQYFIDAIDISKVDAATGSVDSGKSFDLEPTPVTPPPADPSVSIGDAQVSEGNNGATLSFPVTVTGPNAQAVTVHYATSNGTATAGSDYTATSGDLTIPAGQTTGHFTVPVLSDTVVESDETLTVTLTPVSNGTVADGSGTGTILNDDVPVEPGPTAITAVLTGADNGAEDDRLKVNAPSSAYGATVKLFRYVDGVRKLVRTSTLRANGNRAFTVDDKNGNRRTKYIAKVSRTETTLGDWTNPLRVR